jgi:hypothetical protein
MTAMFAVAKTPVKHQNRRTLDQVLMDVNGFSRVPVFDQVE